MATTAIIETPVRAAPDAEETERSVQLECVLCPKKPKFSDSSHLLTHISSKAHLHQKFSMEFKAKSDVIAKGKLEVYDKWYKANEIERLLSERMSSKVNGRAPRRSRASAAPRKSRARKSTSAIESIKADAGADSGCRTPNNLPPLAHWNTAPVGRSGDYASVRDSPYLAGTLYNTPITARQQSSYPYPEDVSGGSLAIKRDPFGPSLALGTAPPSEVGSAFGASFTDEDFLQGGKLKGIVWPGMDLFDAATPDQKKKRNQRKDDAALDLLKVTSENVTATETVWGPEGNIRKVRDLYASPSSVEGSPPSTPPPRRVRKARARASTSATLTPLSAMKAEGSQGDLSTTKGTGRLPGGLPKTRPTRAAARAADGEDKSKDSVPNTSIEDAVLALAGHNPRSTFNVYYEGNANTAVDPQTALADGNHDNSFDQGALHTRPALQQLDPNMSIAEGSPYFKHSTTPSHFFDNGSQSPHTSYRSTQQAPYASGYQGMSNSTLHPLCSQPRTGSIYPQFENPMFSGNTGSANDGNTASFHGTTTRRMGYNNFGIDTGSPFGYNDQRDPNIRDGSYTDPNFQGTNRLFEM
ncbi:hypothetical protein SBRCBS47491_000934 [Sporothrix bragantina]|uniref:C2H2-type domain-containing protein n=1 Tax=Sporothrix bragantina TaxID=671064 RepID=A0ABP0AUF1_9PEZI